MDLKPKNLYQINVRLSDLVFNLYYSQLKITFIRYWIILYLFPTKKRLIIFGQNLKIPALVGRKQRLTLNLQQNVVKDVLKLRFNLLYIFCSLKYIFMPLYFLAIDFVKSLAFGKILLKYFLLIHSASTIFIIHIYPLYIWKYIFTRWFLSFYLKIVYVTLWKIKSCILSL